jgi:hypothetical protein
MKAKCFSALVLLAVLAVPIVQAQELPPSFCMVDGFAFEWNIVATSCSGCVCTITGTVNNIGGAPWAASGTINKCTGQVNLTATNPTPDNCTTMSGSFNYTGSFSRSGPGTYSGSGSWTNDCGLAGTWTGNASRGPCPLRSIVYEGVTPAMSQEAAAALLASVTTPSGYALGRSAPNPFTEATSISYEVPEAAHVRLAVYDVLGREVALLVDGAMDAGSHTVQFSGADLPAGTYVYRIQAGSFAATQQMMLVK